MQEQNKFSIEKWDHRHWAVFEGYELVCVTVYRKGALEVKKRLEQRASEQPPPAVESAISPSLARPTQ